MIFRALGAVARFLWADDDERAIRIEKKEEGDIDVADYIEDLGDGCFSIDFAKYEASVNDKIYDLTTNGAPECSHCKKRLPAPEFSWHGRLYCRRCLLTYEVLRSELDPDLKCYRWPIAIVYLEDGARFPILWNFRSDTLDDWRYARRHGLDVEFYDPIGSKIIIAADLVTRFKVPNDCHIEVWTTSIDDFVKKKTGR